jgi:hypothetical protein
MHLYALIVSAFAQMVPSVQLEKLPDCLCQMQHSISAAVSRRGNKLPEALMSSTKLLMTIRGDLENILKQRYFFFLKNSIILVTQ